VATTPPPPIAQPAPTPVDPKAPDNSNEPPPTAVVPPRTTPHIPTPVDQAVARVLDEQVKAAQQTATGALAASQAADLLLGKLEAEQRKQQRVFESLHADEAAAAQRLVTQRQSMRTRAVAIYVAGPGEPLIPLGTDIQEFGRRRVLVQALYAADRRTLDRYLEAKKAAGSNVDAIVAGLEELNAKVIAARADSEAKAAAVQNGLRGVGTAQSIGPTSISGFAFPVAEPHNFVDTFGAPRSGGRSHEGNDIFAPYGTPLLAAERGVIEKVGVNTLGGTKLWIAGESGTSYYYAHLSAYAAITTDGALVEPGDVVGFVGNSGDAITTPPHLHFEIHPGGGPAIDPYAILKAADQATKLLAAQQPAPLVAPPTLPAPAPATP
jgi:murein DD-endopeptidase MepM/ murein hydrolase activator NlpD